MKMIYSIQTLFTLLSVSKCQKITHELPRVNPFKSPQPHAPYSQHLHDVGLAPHHPLNHILPQKPYVSPLRPGYQWPVVSESEVSSLHLLHPPPHPRPHHPHHLTHQIPTHRHLQPHLPALVPPPTEKAPVEYVSTIKYSEKKSSSKEAPFSLEESANLSEHVERLAREESDQNVHLGTTVVQITTTTTTATTTATPTQLLTTGTHIIDQNVIDGDSTQGEYRVALPDGRVQVCIKKYKKEGKNCILH